MPRLPQILNFGTSPGHAGLLRAEGLSASSRILHSGGWQGCAHLPLKCSQKTGLVYLDEAEEGLGQRRIYFGETEASDPSLDSRED